jgi:hypothetical protein
MKRLILILPLLLAGCSWVNYDEQTKLQIAELQKDATVAQVACDRLVDINTKINYLTGYLYSSGAKNTPPSIRKSDSKPILHGYDCIIDDKWTTEYREYKDSEVSYLKECWAFMGRKDCWVVNDTSENCFKQ